MKHYGDITKINGSLVEPVNVVIGGSPCQDYADVGIIKISLLRVSRRGLPVNGPGSLWSNYG